MMRDKYDVLSCDEHYHKLVFSWDGHLAKMVNYDRPRVSYQTLIFKDWYWIQELADRNGDRQRHARYVRT